MVSDIPAEYIPHIADIDTSGPLMPPIIPVYIYVGSSMGRSMIGRIVHKQMPSESASYISASDEKVDMKKFVAEANTLITNIDDRDLYDAVDAMWQAIISNYKYYLGLSPL